LRALLKYAEAQNQADEDRYGPDDHNGGLPSERKRRADRLKVIEAAKARLDERQRQTDKAAVTRSSRTPATIRSGTVQRTASSQHRFHIFYH
jgi:hypothetical protein